MHRPYFLPQVRRSPTRREPVTAHLRRPPSGAVVPRHRHSYGQLSIPVRGSLRVQTTGQTFVVPVFRALWIPPQEDHEVIVLGDGMFCVAYLHHVTDDLPSDRCCVVQMTRLMRDLVEALTSTAPDGGTRHRLLMQLLLEEARPSTHAVPTVPLPRDRRLLALCRELIDDPGCGKSLAHIEDEYEELH
jgi:hypothetical protein